MAHRSAAEKAEQRDILRRVREGPPLTQKERERHRDLLAFAFEVEKALQQQPWWRALMDDKDKAP